MNPYLLIDFGSTYTKLTAVDLDRPRVLGTASANTTVADGLSAGFQEALARLEKAIGPVRYEKRLAASSAAGGLKIIAVGLVPELTVAAAKQAALGAGGRVLKAYGFELTAADCLEMADFQPDLILLAGGTDGGNQQILLHNSGLLAQSELAAPIIIAGNRSATPQAAAKLAASGKVCYQAPNVLPRLGELNTVPVQRRIREIFLERIIHAKGLDRVEQFIDGIIMPTPAAVLDAAVCLADGAGGNAGWGELLLVDVGGATTDVHSVAAGLPTRANVSLRGLPEPRVKRTVEGDLGMRYSAGALADVFALEQIAGLAQLPVDVVAAGIERRCAATDFLPEQPAEVTLELTLGFLAVKGAVERHVGHLEQNFTPAGPIWVQTGKDLTNVAKVIGTGGILAHQPQSRRIVAGALAEPAAPDILKPARAELVIDRHYLIPTLGLLVKEFPEVAFTLLTAALSAKNNAASEVNGKVNDV